MTLVYGQNQESIAIVLLVVFINELSWLGVEVICDIKNVRLDGPSFH